MPIENVLFIYLDDAHNDDFAVQFPYLSTEPHGNWITFPNAVCDTPLCGPSRGHIITGRRMWETEIWEHSTMPESLEPFYGSTLFDDAQTAGAYTGAIGKWINNWSPADLYPSGLDFGFLRRSDSASADAYTNVDWKRDDGASGTETGYFTDRCRDEALAFIGEAVTAATPWFLYLPVGATHNPFVPADRHAAADVGRSIPPHFGYPGNLLPGHPNAWDGAAGYTGLSTATRADVLNVQEKKRRTMLAVDDAIEDIMADLNTRGILNDTVIIIANDNGVNNGHYGYRPNTGQKRLPYRTVSDPMLRVRWPGVTPRIERSFVGHLDICATIHGILGTTPTLTLHGRDMTTLVTTGVDATWRKSIASSHREGTETGGDRTWWNVRAGRWSYTEWYGTQLTLAACVDANITDVTLYDLNADPLELRNVAATEADVAAACKLLLVEHKADPTYGGGFDDLP